MQRATWDDLGEDLQRAIIERAPFDACVALKSVSHDTCRIARSVICGKEWLMAHLVVRTERTWRELQGSLDLDDPYQKQVWNAWGIAWKYKASQVMLALENYTEDEDEDSSEEENTEDEEDDDEDDADAEEADDADDDADEEEADAEAEADADDVDADDDEEEADDADADDEADEADELDGLDEVDDDGLNAYDDGE